MKALVIGSGGREHAICYKLSQSNQVTDLYCAPGNPGTAEVAENIPLAVDKVEEIALFAQEKNIDLTIVGPEYPLTLGIVDLFKQKGLRVFGPAKSAARLEGSKNFAKEIMISCGVPTAKHETFQEKSTALEYLDQVGAPIVIKADGLAAGKGVFVCSEINDAKDALDQLFAESGTEVVIEECLSGVEASFIAAVSGDVIVPLASSHDYKRIGDEDQGPNTGGMGAVSPTPHLTSDQERQVVEEVLRPVVNEMRDRGTPFCGFLYAGLMISPSGEMKVLEFNARLGDPEAQVIVRRMKSDLFNLLYSLSGKELGSESQILSTMEWDEQSAVCLVLAAEGYPGKVAKGDEILGIDEANSQEGVVVFHAGTGLNEKGSLVTSGGRVLNVTALGDDVAQARERAYGAAAATKFRGKQMRKDIARG